MAKTNTNKYEYQVADEFFACPHCKIKDIFHVEFHFEKRPRRKDGRVVIPIELLETKVYDIPPPVCCNSCGLISKCKDCEIILCNWKRHTSSWKAKANPELCEACWDWKVVVINSSGVA